MAVRERHGDSARWQSEKDMEIALVAVRERHGDSARWGQRKTWR